MKRLLYVIPLILFFGCNNVPEKDLLSEIETIESDIENATVAEPEAFEYATLTEQKLQEYADLWVLQYKHPEFAKNIEIQMQELYKDSVPWFTERDSIGIEVLSKIGSTKSINDSIKKITLQYSAGTNIEYDIDTIVAVIKTKKFMLDGNEATAVTVSFEKHND